MLIGEGGNHLLNKSILLKGHPKHLHVGQADGAEEYPKWRLIRAWYLNSATTSAPVASAASAITKPSYVKSNPEQSPG